MKFHEKYLWLGAFVIMGAVIHQQYTANNNLSYIIQSYELESQIQDRQLMDISSQIRMTQAEEYNKGFENGRTQAAITLMEGGSLNGYTEGYHAALSQFGSDPLVYPQSSQDYLLDALVDSLSAESDIEETYLEIIDLLLSSTDVEVPEDVPSFPKSETSQTK